MERGRELKWAGIQHIKAVCTVIGSRAILSAGSLNATRAAQRNVEFLASGPLSAQGRAEWSDRFEAIFGGAEECGPFLVDSDAAVASVAAAAAAVASGLDTHAGPL